MTQELGAVMPPDCLVQCMNGDVEAHAGPGRDEIARERIVALLSWRGALAILISLPIGRSACMCQKAAPQNTKFKNALR